MKKLLSVLMVVAVVFAFSACGTSATDDQGSTEATSAAATTGHNLGDYEVTFGDAAIGDDYDGTKCFFVAYEFGNYSEDTTGAYTAVYAQAFQDGVELESAFAVDYPDGDWENGANNYMKDIRPDNTISVCESFILTSDSPVEVEITELISFSELKVAKTYDVVSK